MGTPVDTVNFSINGVSHTVNVADYSNHSLASYVREVAGLTGTKVITIVENCKINRRRMLQLLHLWFMIVIRSPATRVAVVLVSSRWTKAMASLWGALMRWEFDHKTHLLADICICICICVKDANLFILCLGWHNVPIWHLKCTSSLYHLEHMYVMSYFPFFFISHLVVLHSASLLSLFALAGRSPPWKGLEPRFFIFFFNISSNLVVFVDIPFNVQPNYHPIQLELASNGGTQCGFCRFPNQLFANDIPYPCSVFFILLPISLPAPAWWCSCTRSCRSTRTPPWSRSTTSWTATSAGGLHNSYSTLLHTYLQIDI